MSAAGRPSRVPRPRVRRGRRAGGLVLAVATVLGVCLSGAGWSLLAQGRAQPLERALDDARHGRYQEAEAALRGLADSSSSATATEATLELGLLLQYLGRRAEATRRLDDVLSRRASSTEELVYAGRAAHALGEFRLANEAFQDAADRAPNDVALNIAWGDLFLQTHNRAEAARSYQLAVDGDAMSATAYAGLAEALAEDSPPTALEAAQQAVSLDRTQVRALLLIASLQLDRGERDEAQQTIERALEVNSSNLEAHALRGAIAYLEDRVDDFRTEVGFVQSINPVYGEIYRVAASVAARNYRFGEAVALSRQGLQVDPENATAYADLGMHLLRTGEEAEARQALERAFEADPFNTITFNLLNMLDTLDTFDTVREGNLIVRFHPDETSVMREYVLPLAQRAVDEFSRRYQFTPQGPIIIEVFPKHDDFAVRNLGLPGMNYALGACFGRVVTMDSPRARPPGDFSWEATLWHELAHVFTIQMSQQRVPRWLTEGVSQYEEARADPRWGREMEVSFAQAMLNDRILTLDDLNAGFTDPQLISLAYYEASLLVAHIVDRFGDAALRQLVRVYGDGLEEEEALEAGLGVDLDDLQASFDDALEAKFAPLLAALKAPTGIEEATEDGTLARALAAASPGSFAAQLTYGRYLWQQGELDAARETLERAGELVPMATGQNSPNMMLAAIAVQQGDREKAMAALEALLAHDQTDVEAARMLVRLLRESDRPDAGRLIAAYETIVSVDPFDAAAHVQLGRLLRARGDFTGASQALRVALAAGATDRAAVHADLAEAYRDNGQLDLAKRETIAALEVAPAYERAQELLLDLRERN